MTENILNEGDNLEVENQTEDLVEFDKEESEPFEDAPIDELAKIVSYNVANTVEVLKLKVDNQEINMKPEFQRDFVWDINRASLLLTHF